MDGVRKGGRAGVQQIGSRETEDGQAEREPGEVIW